MIMLPHDPDPLLPLRKIVERIAFCGEFPCLSSLGDELKESGPFPVECVPVVKYLLCLEFLIQH